MLFVGIDNGADGAVVAITSQRQVLWQEPAPVVDVKTTKGGTKRIPNPQRMEQLLREMTDAGFRLVVVLEKAQAFPNEGAVASFNYGRGYGCWEGVLAGRREAYTIVDPKVWQRAELAGIEGVDTKARALLRAQRSLTDFRPVLRGCRVAHKGIPDAACIALYALRMSAELSAVG